MSMMRTEGTRVGSGGELSHALAHVRRGTEVLNELWSGTFASSEAAASGIALAEASQALHRALTVLQDMGACSPEPQPQHPAGAAYAEAKERVSPYVPNLASELAMAIMDLVADGIVVVDQQMAIRFANPLAETIFRYGNEELVGLAVERVLPGWYHEAGIRHRHRYAIALLPRPVGMVSTMLGRRSDGSPVSLQVSLSPITVGTDEATIVAVREVSQHRTIVSSSKRRRPLRMTNPPQPDSTSA
jgi:PAS domain S-box-containing protein